MVSHSLLSVIGSLLAVGRGPGGIAPIHSAVLRLGDLIDAMLTVVIADSPVVALRRTIAAMGRVLAGVKQ